MSRWRNKLAALAAVSVASALLAAPAAAQPSGNEQAPRVQVEYAPTMLVLDGSGSMKDNDPSGGTKMAAAKNSVHSLVDMLPDDARLGLTTYGTETGETPAEKEAGCQDVSVLQDVKQLDRQAITTAVDGIQPSGYTPIGHSLRTAADQLPDDKQRAIVLVSDGLDTCAPPDPCDVADELAEEGINTVVHAVGFGVDDEASEQLNCIAETTGGTYTRAPDAEALEQALPRITSVALRNYQPAGESVTGTQEPAGAPEIGPGQYVDSLGPQQRKHYAVDIPEGGTGYFSATVPLARGEGGIADVDALGINVISPSGAECVDEGGVRTTASMGQDGEPLTAQFALDTTSGSMSGGCQEAGTYTMYVLRDSGTAQQTELPVEMQIGIEPPVTGSKGEPAETSNVELREQNGQAQPVIGGGSFSSAATLDDSGAYQDSLAHGEYVFYRVNLDWGQGLAYQVNFADNDDARIANIKTDLYTPNRYTPLMDGGNTDAYTGNATTLGPLATPPVRYLNREGSERHHSVADWYYIGVKLGQGGGNNPPPTLVDIELELTVTGEPENGPEYASNGGTEAEDVFGEQRDTQNTANIAEAPTTNSFPLVPVLAGAGGVALLGGTAATIWLIRRRNRIQP
ncbi:Ca-activated chloride channel family protein [Tamaricihabitans halophyticus]|uniref:Ca-activated chloride channel family protein n=1 Tax=Tamaricihabitans halophyticus TaxID=1262583 RepID=A0A4R2QCZ3_9PSEU|nr:VWA domain-containing protein [Tamaricihabitans halophyticus]TCP46837.1 Ca-activated chloride channel family protein [Tamaricihabitans halophyticus]